MPAMADTIRVGPDGFVEAPTKPGLGYDVDWDDIDDRILSDLDSPVVFR